MRWFHTVILLPVLVLAVGCLPTTTPVEAGVGVVVLGFACVLPALGLLVGLGLSSDLSKVKERKTALVFFLGACFLIGGGLIAIGGWLAGWWGQ
jgi:hypothetical protein